MRCGLCQWDHVGIAWGVVLDVFDWSWCHEGWGSCLLVEAVRECVSGAVQTFARVIR